MTAAGGVGLITHELVHVFRTEGHDVAALSGVSLTVSAGEVVGLLGPSGSGKSTLLLACAALLRPSAGRLLIDGIDILGLDDPARDRFRALRLGIALQGAGRNLLGYLTVAENVELAQRASRASRAGERARHDLPRVDELVDIVGLGSDPTARADRLSAGRQQLLALACALSNRPQLLLADEPTSQLGPAARDVVIECLRAVNERWGSTVVLVTHDPAVAEALPRTVTIRDGRIGMEGRHGEEYSVITADGSLSLPAEVLVDFPAGTLVRIDREGSSLRLDPIRSGNVEAEE